MAYMSFEKKIVTAIQDALNNRELELKDASRISATEIKPKSDCEIVIHILDPDVYVEVKKDKYKAPLSRSKPVSIITGPRDTRRFVKEQIMMGRTDEQVLAVTRATHWQSKRPEIIQWIKTHGDKWRKHVQNKKEIPV